MAKWTKDVFDYVILNLRDDNKEQIMAEIRKHYGLKLTKWASVVGAFRKHKKALPELPKAGRCEKAGCESDAATSRMLGGKAIALCQSCADIDAELFDKGAESATIVSPTSLTHDSQGAPLTQFGGYTVEPSDCPTVLRAKCLHRARRHFAGKKVKHRVHASGEDFITFRFNRYYTTKYHGVPSGYNVTVRKTAA